MTIVLLVPLPVGAQVLHLQLESVLQTGQLVHGIPFIGITCHNTALCCAVNIFMTSWPWKIRTPRCRATAGQGSTRGTTGASASRVPSGLGAGDGLYSSDCSLKISGLHHAERYSLYLVISVSAAGCPGAVEVLPWPAGRRWSRFSFVIHQIEIPGPLLHSRCIPGDAGQPIGLSPLYCGDVVDAAIVSHRKVCCTPQFDLGADCPAVVTSC